MRLVNDNNVCQFSYALKMVREVTLATEVGVAEYSQVAEVDPTADAADVWQPFPKSPSGDFM